MTCRNTRMRSRAPAPSPRLQEIHAEYHDTNETLLGRHQTDPTKICGKLTTTMGATSYQSVDNVAQLARPSHRARGQGTRVRVRTRTGRQPSRIGGFEEGAQRSHSATRAVRSPDGLFQRAAEHLYSNGRDPPNVAASRR